jgi:Flp pilus assembly protein TadD
MCEQLRQFAPENPQYHMCAGTLLTRMNRIDDALLAVKQAIELEPNNATFRRIYDQIQKRR